MKETYQETKLVREVMITLAGHLFKNGKEQHVTQSEYYKAANKVLEETFITSPSPTGRTFEAVSVEKELPEKEGYYFIEFKDGKKQIAFFNTILGYFIEGCSHWLREVSVVSDTNKGVTAAEVSSKIDIERKKRDYQTFQFNVGAAWAIRELTGYGNEAVEDAPTLDDFDNNLKKDF